MKQPIFIVSDGTGITAEALSQSLISQFENIAFDITTIPYVDNIAKAQQVVDKINLSYEVYAKKPIVFATLVCPDIRSCLQKSSAKIFDFFNTFLEPLEEALGANSSYTVGRSHGLINQQTYKERIEAINYTLAHDDGLNLKNYAHADIILLGVSRSGKTPTCLYMALQYGLLAANYPLTEEDIGMSLILPESLKPYKKKLFGLTIAPESLHQIRSERKPNSRYAQLSQCRQEVEHVERLFKQENIPYLNTTYHSIEEISTKIIAMTGIKRRIT